MEKGKAIENMLKEEKKYGDILQPKVSSHKVEEIHFENESICDPSDVISLVQVVEKQKGHFQLIYNGKP